MQFYKLISENIQDAKGTCIALLGGGGKTALLHKLAVEFAEYYPAVLQTSITKTAFSKQDNPFILDTTNIGQIVFPKENPLFVIGKKISDEKLLGISEIDLEQIKYQFNVTIFECDGARNKPLKAHTEYDPKVPEFATHTIVIIGADVVNTKIQDGFVHRSELFCKKWKVQPDFRLNVDFIANVVTSKRGYLAKVGHDAKLIYFINKFDQCPENSVRLAETICEVSGKPTFYGSLKNNILHKI